MLDLDCIWACGAQLHFSPYSFSLSNLSSSFINIFSQSVVWDQRRHWGLLNKTKKKSWLKPRKLGFKSQRWSQVTFKSCSSPSQIIIPEWSDSQPRRASAVNLWARLLFLMCLIILLQFSSFAWFFYKNNCLSAKQKLKFSLTTRVNIRMAEFDF